VRRSIAAGAVAVAAAAGCLALVDGGGVGGAYAAGALPSWLLMGALLWRARAAAGAGAPPSLGLATRITLGRALLVSLTAGFLLVPPLGWLRWLPGPLYTAAALGDQADGIVARRRGETSSLGASLDVAVDALGLLLCPAVAVAWGRLPAWYLLLGAAYYVFHAGIRVRRALGLPAHAERLRKSRHARFYAGVQMGVVAASLFPVLPFWLTATAATIAMVPTLALFARDWLIVTGRLAPAAGAALR